MVAKLCYFAVDNGDMTLVEFESGKKLLIDVNARKKGEDPDDKSADVIAQLKERLNKDDTGRPYVDAFLLSHPDQDHCRGFAEYFHTGPLSNYVQKDGKVVIRQLWSSPLIFRRASKTHPLCADAKVFNAEARRRVALYKQNSNVGDGDRILIMGEDVNGKTDQLGSILVKLDEEFQTINGSSDSSFKARLLAPLSAADDEEDLILAKNNSSVIVRFLIRADNNYDACRYLTGGDAHVGIWERIWDRHVQRKDWLSYDMLLTPHHCSWHSLSYDSWSDLDEKVKVAPKARSALSQARRSAALIASCKHITDENGDPPCTRAEREYKDIADDADGSFLCVMDEADDKDKSPVVFEIGSSGPKRAKKGFGSGGPPSSSAFITQTPSREFDKQGGRRYA